MANRAVGTDGGMNPVDSYVGARIRLRRRMLGLSQEKLGNAVGLSFQQVQKYEKGANRIGAGKLWRFAEFLGVPVGFFFEGVDENIDGIPAGVAESASDVFDAHMDRETNELVDAYYAIKDEKLRNRYVGLLRAIGETG